MAVRGTPTPGLLGSISSYYGFEERTAGPKRRREGPGRDIVVIVSFGEEWLIDGERFTSFAAGPALAQVTTEHAGRSHGMHLNVAPPAARRLLGVPLQTLAGTRVPLEDVFAEPFLVERLYDAGSWDARFRLLDKVFLRRLATAGPASPEMMWAWRRLLETDGRVAIRSLAEELGWSRKRIVARFRDEIGLAPKAAARLLRFMRAKELAESAARPDWARIAAECGYADQSHLSNEFRAITQRTPVTFLQDAAAQAA